MILFVSIFFDAIPFIFIVVSFMFFFFDIGIYVMYQYIFDAVLPGSRVFKSMNTYMYCILMFSLYENIF